MRLEFPNLIYATGDAIATIAFNRPERLK